MFFELSKAHYQSIDYYDALRSVLKKHAILRTSLIFNNDNGTLKQYITDKHQTFTLATEADIQK